MATKNSKGNSVLNSYNSADGCSYNKEDINARNSNKNASNKAANKASNKSSNKASNKASNSASDRY